jgi:hypothetical protein
MKHLVGVRLLDDGPDVPPALPVGNRKAWVIEYRNAIV